ncbi:MAG: RNA polymerase sporulation sigma factor SigH [Lachnospira sp.]|nr:RNA polymerase sporulation sigma factor SigH [Lachnospira sp.]MDD5829118.1 RNA polymerase sporulation sigma factor SigH [Lachnospira sp.]
MINLNKYSDEELVNLYRQGNEQAVEYLFEKYKNLVRKKAKAMYLAGGDNDDLIQEGMIGLYKAVRDYKEERDASFFTFASMCINRQMITAVTASNRKKNIPLNSYVSFDSPVSGEEDSDMKLADVLPPSNEQNPEKLFIDKEFANDLQKKVMASLSSFEKEVLKYYMDGKDYIEISEKMNKTPKSIDNALQRIRNKVDKIAKL